MINPDDETPREVDNDEFFELFECAPWTTGRTIMRRRGFEPLIPEDIPDDQFTGRLWELLYALAAHRCFFHGTDGLTDAELYRYLHRWLDEPHEDIPLCLEMNCRHDCSYDETSLDFLKYASDDERAMWQEMDPALELPPKENPPADRDRWMPQPPDPPFVPDNATGGIPPEWLLSDEDDNDDDPLGLAAVDAAIAANRTDDERAAVSKSTPPPPCENWQRPDRLLQRTGFTPIPPDELTDESLGAHLWEFIHQLAIRNFFVTRTDHLSDAALYHELWTKAIREEALMPPARSRTSFWMHDILGSCSENEINLELAIYATDEARARHAKEFPNWPLPEKRERLIHRDWRLPRPPF